MKKNSLRLFAIIAIIIVVAGITFYYESYDRTDNQRNSGSKSHGITYPTGNLTGATEIYILNNVSGSSTGYLDVPDGTVCMVFLMYTNNSLACVNIYNSTGGSQVTLNNSVTSTHIEEHFVPYKSPLSGPDAQNWHIFYNVHMETGGAFNFEIFAADFMLGEK